VVVVCWNVHAEWPLLLYRFSANALTDDLEDSVPAGEIEKPGEKTGFLSEFITGEHREGREGGLAEGEVDE
jgi:hypothetical protein